VTLVFGLSDITYGQSFAYLQVSSALLTAISFRLSLGSHVCYDLQLVKYSAEILWTFP